MALLKFLKPRSETSEVPDSSEESDMDSLPCKRPCYCLEEGPSPSTSTSSGKQSRKFNLGWMRGRKQWLVYKPEGMYCSLCQKYDKRPYNRDVWNKQPCSRLRLQSRVSYRIFCWGGGRSNCKGSASVRKHGHTRVSVRAT